MSLIVEDGTGLATAESYCSVAFADAYHAARGNGDAWDAAPDKEAALRLATDFMGNTYRLRWKGYRTTQVQALDWPRSIVQKPDDIGGGYGSYPAYYLPNQIPVEILQACCELAIRTISGPLAPDISPEDMASRVKVGPIEVQYKDTGIVVVLFRAVEAKLSPFFLGMPGVARLVRT